MSSSPYIFGAGAKGHVGHVVADTAADFPTDGRCAPGSTGAALDEPGVLYTFNGSTWDAVSGGGGGGGAPTNAEYLTGASNASLSAERVVTDTTTVAWDLATSGQAKANVPDDSIGDAKLRNSAGVSVIGRSANSTGDPADIVAGADDQLLRRVSGSLSFGTATTAMLAANIVTFAKLQQLTTDRLLGRDTAGTGDAEQLTVGGGLEFTGSGGIQRSALAGDVTASAGSGTTAIASNAVTYAQMQDISAQYRLLGRVSSGAGDPEEVVLDTDGTLAANSDSRVATQKAVKTYLALASNLPAHATSHKHGGSDEIATATAAANAIPKAGSGGTLDRAWIPAYYSPVLDRKASSDTPDDEFASGSLAGKWTVVNGASGTVDLFEAGTTISRYDLSTRSGWLLVQVGKNSGQAVRLRQDFTIPDGSSIVAALSVVGGQSATSASNNAAQYGLGLNSTDGTFASGTWEWLIVDGQSGSQPRILIDGSAGGITDAGTNSGLTSGALVYLRIARVSLTYTFFFSTNGFSTWQPIGARTFASAPDNLWLIAECNTTFTAPVPIIAFDWIRQGSNALDPW